MPDRGSIEDAARRIAPHVRRTPVLRVAGGELGLAIPLALKLELLQHTGSFKPRGAFNRMLRAQMLGAGVPGAGVIAASGGNHGAAVAYAAHELRLPAEIFVPARTPDTKRARIRGFGARLVEGGANYAQALAASRERQRETGALEVHAYDDEDVLSGQGTVGRELEQDEPELTHVLVATGGGGLIGGIAAWYDGRAAVVSVEPEGCPTLHDALRRGEPTPVATGGLAADSLGAERVGALMFPVARRRIQHSVLVTDAAIRDAQLRLWDALRLVAEPGGAAALAALTSGAWVPPPGARVGVVLCGANTDPGSVGH